MDDIDIRILEILSEHARLTVSEISNRVNMSVPAVSERIKKLECSGIIEKYTILIDQRKLKKDLTAFMFVSIERSKCVTDFLNTIKDSKDVLECHYIAGDYDYLLKIVTENTLSLETLLNRIKSVNGVQKTKTVIVLSTKKNIPSVLL